MGNFTAFKFCMELYTQSGELPGGVVSCRIRLLLFFSPMLVSIP